ncbi:Uncharacterized membrane protein [Salegentibacter echinorum]|uniref:Uncharacterized membrane protein n=1 Tax=Salegentibacter echinorum TaxID=1073325 RepID=A0A1M5BYR5_SALEC|nr:DUF2254 domain-containing protein [Salegentibacter echinorum]SHF47673.1 Uncharacterized membrane protein [Salegentibacter echinorum]
MKYFFNRIFIWLKDLRSKIAFYPSLFAIFGFFFALFIIYLEDLGASKYLLDAAPILVVDNGNTALSILTACITGLISMMVFSFSMVMVLLNQSASNYSPRLLPGLISDKNHQIILGIYLATIIYCIFVSQSIQPEGNSYQVPGFSVLIGILFTVLCLSAFIYFIHNISQSIQIDNILDRIYNQARKRLNFLLESEKELFTIFPETEDWTQYYSEKSGYFQDLSSDNIAGICDESATRIEIIPIKGSFIPRGTPMFKSEKKLDEDAVNKILSNFSLGRGELVTQNYVLAFKQITEVIVKAMSPGINDPGTALNALDYLTELLALRMRKRDDSYFLDEEGKNVLIKIRSVSFGELCYQVFAPIRAYCKHDIIILQKVGLMFIFLKKQKTADEAYLKVIDAEAQNFLEDGKANIKNKTDLHTIRNIAEELNIKI